MESIKDTLETNKLIADFMGKPYDYLICDACGKMNPELANPGTKSRITKCCPFESGNYGKTYRPHEADPTKFAYHTSWDWLMPVVEKIENLFIDGRGVSVMIDGYGAVIRQDESNAGGQKFDPNIIANTLNINYFINEPENYKKKIDGVYKAVIHFIEWYNQHPTN